jgi:hypothetical protein
MPSCIVRESAPVQAALDVVSEPEEVVAIQLVTERHDGAHEVVLQRGGIRRAWAGLVRDIGISDICVGSLIAECRLVVR